MLWFIYLAKLRTDLLDNRSLAILLETYKLLICYTLVFGQPLSHLLDEQGHALGFVHQSGLEFDGKLHIPPDLVVTPRPLRAPLLLGRHSLILGHQHHRLSDVRMTHEQHRSPDPR
jgi:hypothetical protein